MGFSTTILKHNNIKKLILISICVILTLMCCGCQFIKGIISDIGGKQTWDEDDIFTETIDSLFEAIDEKNPNDVAALFAPNIAAENDMENQIKRLFEFYDGPTDSVYNDGMYAGTYSSDYGVCTKSCSNSFTVTSKDTRYYCYMNMCYRDDTDDKNVGITSFYIVTEPYKAAIIQDEKEWPNGGAISVADYPNCPYQVRCIGGQPYYFTAIERSLTRYDIENFLQQSDSYKEFAEQFGIYNAQSYDGSCYYELTDDGRVPLYALILYNNTTKQISHVYIVSENPNEGEKIFEREKE